MKWIVVLCLFPNDVVRIKGLCPEIHGKQQSSLPQDFSREKDFHGGCYCNPNRRTEETENAEVQPCS